MYNSKNNFFNYFLRENIYIDHRRRQSKDKRGKLVDRGIDWSGRYKSDSVNIRSKIPGLITRHVNHLKGDKKGGALPKGAEGDAFTLFREPSQSEVHKIIIPAINQHIKNIEEKNAKLPPEERINVNDLKPASQEIQRNLYTQFMVSLGLINKRYSTKAFKSEEVGKYTPNGEAYKTIEKTSSILGERARYRKFNKKIKQLYETLKRLGIEDETPLFKLQELIENSKFALLDRFGYEFFDAFTKETVRVVDPVILREPAKKLDEASDFDADTTDFGDGLEDYEEYGDADDGDDAVELVFGDSKNNKARPKNTDIAYGHTVRTTYDQAILYKTWDEVLTNLKRKIKKGEHHLMELFNYLVSVSQKPLFKDEEPNIFLTYIDKAQQIRTLLEEPALWKIYNAMIKSQDDPRFEGKVSHNLGGDITVADLKYSFDMRLKRLEKDANALYKQQWREIADTEATMRILHLEKEMVKAGYEDGIRDDPYEFFSFLYEHNKLIYDAFCDITGIESLDEFHNWKTFKELNDHIWGDPLTSVTLWISAAVNYRKRGDLDYHSGSSGEKLKWKNRSIKSLSAREALRVKLDSEDVVEKILKAEDNEKKRGVKLRLSLEQLKQRRDDRVNALSNLKLDIADLNNKYDDELEWLYKAEKQYKEGMDEYEHESTQTSLGKGKKKLAEKKDKLDQLSNDINTANKVIDELQNRIGELERAASILSKMIAADTTAIRKKSESEKEGKSYEERLEAQKKDAHEIYSKKVSKATTAEERSALAKAFDPNGILAAFGRALKGGNAKEIKRDYSKDHDTQFAELQITVLTSSFELIKKAVAALKIAACSMEQLEKSGAEQYMSSFSRSAPGGASITLEYPANSSLFLKLQKDKDYIDELIDLVADIMVKLNVKRVPTIKRKYENKIITFDASSLQDILMNIDRLNR